jgi:hypothetical protein
MNLAQLAAQLASGSITVQAWEAAMRDYLRTQFTDAMILAKGGREFVTFSDWGYMGSALKKQYEFLSNFANDISKNTMSEAQILARMELYKDSAYSALADFMAREALRNGYSEEQNALGVADHCDDCLTQTARGWVAIGQLIPIGERICIVRCKCTMRYRKQNADGSFTES